MCRVFFNYINGWHSTNTLDGSYISSRVFLHNPPGEDNALRLGPSAPNALKHEERELYEGEPEVNQYVCIMMLVLSIGIMATTAEWVSPTYHNFGLGVLLL